MSSQSYILPVKRAFTFTEPPLWVSEFWFHLGMISTAPLNRLTPKTWGRAAIGVVFLIDLEAETDLGIPSKICMMDNVVLKGNVVPSSNRNVIVTVMFPQMKICVEHVFQMLITHLHCKK
jgi:hypothetical protein